MKLSQVKRIILRNLDYHWHTSLEIRAIIGKRYSLKKISNTLNYLYRDGLLDSGLKLLNDKRNKRVRQYKKRYINPRLYEDDTP